MGQFVEMYPLGKAACVVSVVNGLSHCVARTSGEMDMTTFSKQETRASGAVVLTKLSWNIPVSAPEAGKCGHKYIGWNGVHTQISCLYILFFFRHPISLASGDTSMHWSLRANPLKSNRNTTVLSLLAREVMKWDVPLEVPRNFAKSRWPFGYCRLSSKLIKKSLTAEEISK